MIWPIWKAIRDFNLSYDEEKQSIESDSLVEVVNTSVIFQIWRGTSSNKVV